MPETPQHLGTVPHSGSIPWLASDSHALLHRWLSCWWNSLHEGTSFQLLLKSSLIGGFNIPAFSTMTEQQSGISILAQNIAFAYYISTFHNWYERCLNSKLCLWTGYDQEVLLPLQLSPHSQTLRWKGVLILPANMYRLIRIPCFLHQKMFHCCETFHLHV